MLHLAIRLGCVDDLHGLDYSSGSDDDSDDGCLSLSHVEAAPPQERLDMLGNHLFPLIKSMYPARPGKILGMLLNDYSIPHLFDMLNNNTNLQVAVKEASDILAKEVGADLLGQNKANPPPPPSDLGSSPGADSDISDDEVMDGRFTPPILTPPPVHTPSPVHTLPTGATASRRQGEAAVGQNNQANQSPTSRLSPLVLSQSQDHLPPNIRVELNEDGGVEPEHDLDVNAGIDNVEEEPFVDRFQINDRVQCNVPPPIVLAEGSTSWESINKLGGWDSFLVEFPMLEEVPEQHKGAWAAAWSESLRRWRDGENEQEKQTALLWMGFWSQGLQRKPTRGGKQGRVEVASRYKCVLEGDWAGLVERWERDKLKRAEQLSKKREQRRQMEMEEKEQKELDRLRRSVIGLIEAGQLGKAMNRVTSHGLGDISDPNIRTQLTEKFPPRHHQLPPSVPKVRPIDSFRDIRDSFMSLDPGTAPGAGGLRNEYLHALGERLEDEEIKMMEELGLEYLSGSLPSWFYQVWLTMQTVAPYKDEDHEAVRPLGLRNSLIKVFHKEPMVQNKTELREFLEPVQLGLSKAGAALLTRSVSGILHSFRNFICFRIDLKNAFNEMSRRAIMDVIAEEPSISHLETFVAAISAPIVALETGGKRWGESGDGVAQFFQLVFSQTWWS